MPPPPPSPPKQRSELEELQYKASEVTDQSLQSTRNMRELCNEAKEMGIRSLVALDDQGEKLDNIEKGMLQINSDMKEAEENMRGMENCCSLIKFPCAKGSKDDANWKVNDGEGGGGSERPGGPSDAGIPTYGGFVSKYTNDAREEEMEKNMEEVSNMVGNLRNMAVDMGSEIGNQNAQIDRINMMAENNVGRISTANEKARNLLK
ncbi:synaptosomal-associated protein 25 isoform X2 [Folsomia candida]|uniref:Synaptosomal-associated protein 25 n=1 Tax=Folsomia candida TaxID=158441 RepID=A0A226DKP0_FOLCA|nr:synaptosomal-associated protein 25 isoform X2 [Folsomia candida]OXA45414.1 Synaptosomal-associated protein 25 [Folsomia candida]